MLGGGTVIWAIDVMARETMLFAAVGFALGGIDDLAIDAIYLGRTLWRRLTLGQDGPPPSLDDFVLGPCPQRMAIFVAAWDESAVIGAMLTSTLARLDHPDYRLYVGTYPNDRGTIDAVSRLAERDPRVRLVIGTADGPTTKAACLNTIWHAMRREVAADGVQPRAIVIHDAEDVIHAGELRIFDRLIDRHWVVQLPVLPLPDRGSKLVAGHYCDEFAEAHAKQLVVREALGAGLPLAGVGCAIAHAALDAVAATRGGDPFDAASLTEDYELGLQIAALGGSGMLARVPEYQGGPVVAVRAYFPATLDTAVRQKARWMTGIALAGWDRIGWGRAGDIGEHWMRMRDRRAPLAVLILSAAYLALIVWAISVSAHAIAGGQSLSPARPVQILLWINAALLGWRLAVRATFTGLAYGRIEALWSPLRALIGNVIALLAARRAMLCYLKILRGRPPQWDKTPHVFPDPLDAGVKT